MGYNITGHAGYDTKGEDIVCAAISVLAQTVLLSLADVCNIEEKYIEYSIDEGVMNVMISDDLDNDRYMEAEILLNTLEVGVRAIIENYPGYVTVGYREV